MSDSKADIDYEGESILGATFSRRPLFDIQRTKVTPEKWRLRSPDGKLLRRPGELRIGDHTVENWSGLMITGDGRD